MPRRQRSLSHDVPYNIERPGILGRAISLDTAALHQKKQNYVQPTTFCRQSILVSNTDADAEKSKKLIKNGKELLILVSMAFICFSSPLGMSLISPFYPSEAAKKGVDQTVIGLVFAIYPLFVFALSPIAGKWMPRMGVKFCLIAGCFLEGGTEILFGFVDMLPKGNIFIFFSLAIRVVTAMGSSLSAVASLSILTVTFKDHIGTIFGIVELFTGLGYMTGPAIGGVLYEYGGFKMPFLVCGGFVIFVVFCVFWILPPEAAYHTEEETSGETAKELTSISSALRIPGIAVIGVAVVTAGMTLSFLDPTLAPFLKKIDPTITAEKIGLIFVTMPGMYTLFAPVAGYVADKKVPGRVCIIVGQIGLSIGFLFIGPAPFLESFLKPKIWLVAVFCAVIGLAFAPFVVPTLLDMQKSGRNGGLPATFGTDSLLSGLFNGFFSIGSVIGPTLGSAISQKWSFEGACFIFACLTIAQAVLLFFFTIWERNSKWGGKKNEGHERLIENC